MELTRSYLPKREWFKRGHYLGIKYRDERRKQLKRIIRTCIFSVPYMALAMSILERLNVYNRILIILFGSVYLGFLLLISILTVQQMLHQYVEVEVLEGYADLVDNDLVIADKTITGIPKKAKDILQTAWSCILYANSSDFEGMPVFNRLDCYLPTADWEALSRLTGEFRMYVKVYKLKGAGGRFLSLDIFVSREGYIGMCKVFPNKHTG